MPLLSEFQGQPALRLQAPDGARAVVLLHGGQLVSWTPAGGEEQIYLSPTASYGAEVAIRGGVPVVFPQFNQRGELPKHGLVRTREWQVNESVVRDGCAIGVLRFESDAQTQALWPHDFALELTVSVSGRALEMELAVANTGPQAFSFTAALHTYLRCHDVLKLQVEGLQDVDFEDTVALSSGRQWGDVLTVLGEIDRIYRDIGARQITLRELGHRVHLTQVGFNDVVVWNPGEEKCAALPDMPDADWRQMLCIEAACIEQPVVVGPDQEWVGRQCLVA